jgi:hypothetical protein
MVDRSIVTHWRGVYSYDQTYNLPDLYAATEFEMHLTLGWLGRFTGRIDDADPGIPEPATIRGRVTESKISFKKQYSKLWLPDETGKVFAIPGQRSYILHYVGDFIENRNRITGTWQIHAESRWINGVQMEFAACNGSWSARPIVE